MGWGLKGGVPVPVVMHWKSPSARSRMRWPSNCPGLLQKTAGTVVLVLSIHSTSHLILQSQASEFPLRSLGRGGHRVLPLPCPSPSGDPPVPIWGGREVPVGSCPITPSPSRCPRCRGSLTNHSGYPEA